MTQNVLITGASSGFGLETALHLAEHGYRVFATVRDPRKRESVEAVANRRGLVLNILLLDVTDPIGVRSVVETILNDNGAIHVLVNNAGIGLHGFFEDLSEEEIREVFNVNVFGVMSVTKAVLPQMRKAGSGRIIMISSAGGRIASMTMSAYCASKFAVEGFAEALAMEMAPFGVHVSVVEPGLSLTHIFTVNRNVARAASQPNSPYHAWFMRHEGMLDAILRKKHIVPTDVASTVRMALEAQNPHLRYVVGWRARCLIGLKRHLPGELFHRVYSRELIRRVAEQRSPDQEAKPSSEPK